MNPARSYSPIGVEPRHLRRLATKERAAVGLAGTRETVDDVDRDIRRQASGREVVEEEERTCALHEDVVDAVVDQVFADGRVAVHHERHLELGPDAVGAGHQHGVGRARRLQVEEPAEGTDIRQHTRREGALREPADATHDFVAGVDVHP